MRVYSVVSFLCILFVPCYQAKDSGCEKLFGACDVNDNKQCTKEELEDLYERIGAQPPNSVVKETFITYDSSKDGVLEEDEFEKFCDKMTREGESEDKEKKESLLSSSDKKEEEEKKGEDKKEDKKKTQEEGIESDEFND